MAIRIRALPLALLVVAAAAAERGPVALTPVWPTMTREAIVATLQSSHAVYFEPGEYRLGTVSLSGWHGGVILGAARMTVRLDGRFVIDGCDDLRIANLSLDAGDFTTADAAIDIVGAAASSVELTAIQLGAGRDRGWRGDVAPGGIRMRAPGRLLVHECHVSHCTVGLSVEHPLAAVSVLGGNFSSEDLHLRQIAGHLEARAFGTQLSGSGTDIELRAPSPLGWHLIEGIRTEGTDRTGCSDETFVHVAPSAARVDVAVRANTLGGPVRYLDHEATGAATLVENANSGRDEAASSQPDVVARAGAAVATVGNKLSTWWDPVGPFALAGGSTAVSTGDLWLVYPLAPDHVYQPGERFTQPLDDATYRARYPIPAGLTFTAGFADSDATRAGTAAAGMPRFPAPATPSLPRVANLAALCDRDHGMIDVRSFGADGDDDVDDTAAIEAAIDAAVIRLADLADYGDAAYTLAGCSRPIYFPAGRYRVSRPLFLDHQAGGGFWGDGSGRSVIVDTAPTSPSTVLPGTSSNGTGGVVLGDGCGLATFVDIGFVDGAGATNPVVYLGLWNGMSLFDQVTHPDRGASLQGDLFCRACFQGGATGLRIGSSWWEARSDPTDPDHRRVLNPQAGWMGDGCLIVDCDFRDLAATGYFGGNYNTLTNPIVACRFDGMADAIVLDGGSCNSYGNELRHLRRAGISILNVASDAMVVSRTTLDDSPVPLLKTAYSALEAHLLLEECTTAAAASVAVEYIAGGSVAVVDCDFSGRQVHHGGNIGDNTVIADRALLPSLAVDSYAHGFLTTSTRPPVGRIAYTIDNGSAAIFVNGVLRARGPNDGDYRRADVVDDLAELRSFAIAAVNAEPDADYAGFLARATLPDGRAVVSDAQWKVFPGVGAPPADAAGRAWFEDGYDDAAWSQPDVRPFGLGPWDVRELGEPADASWIWKASIARGASPVYLRRSFAPRQALRSTIEYTIDNASVAVYVDGSLQQRGANDGDWSRSDVIATSDEIRSFAIEAWNAEPGWNWAGFLAKATFADGRTVVSDAGWKAWDGVGEPPADALGHAWYDSDYDDRAWPAADVQGTLGVAPWGAPAGLSGLAGASWIWSGDARTGRSPVCLRRSFVPTSVSMRALGATRP